MDGVNVWKPKVYLASSFALKERVQRLHDLLVESDYVVPDVWWNIDLKELQVPDSDWYLDERVVGIANRHWDNIRLCDYFILVSDNKSTKFTGANIELGYALGKHKICFSWGVLERSAMYVPVKQTENIFELLNWMDFERQRMSVVI